MQIYSFWQNSRPQSPKMALFWAIIQIERAPFVSFYSISTQDKATFGRTKLEEMFLYTLLHCNTRKECFWSRITGSWICDPRAVKSLTDAFSDLFFMPIKHQEGSMLSWVICNCVPIVIWNIKFYLHANFCLNCMHLLNNKSWHVSSSSMEATSRAVIKLNQVSWKSYLLNFNFVGKS